MVFDDFRHGWILSGMRGVPASASRRSDACGSGDAGQEDQGGDDERLVGRLVVGLEPVALEDLAAHLALRRRTRR